jgi:hypothetical protein
MATTDQGFEMDESTAGGLDALELPELSEAVWMRLLANALDPDAPPADPGLIPVDGPDTQPDSDLAAAAGASDGVLPDEDGLPDDGADEHAAAEAGLLDDGGAGLLPQSDAAADEALDLGHAVGDAPGGPWADPNDDSAF